jgi:CO/xanthine dehydrogenase Mo-binding subunit
MTISRRDFLKCSGALIVCYSATSLAPFVDAQGPFDTHQSHIDAGRLDSWIAVNGDGSVTAYTGKCDLGQGMFTAQTQLVAEELVVPIGRVKLTQCDTNVSPDQGTTSGSQSTPTNFNSRGLAQAAATAREALITMAAAKWNEPVDQLSVNDGIITGKSGRRISYAELIGDKKFDVPLNAAAKRRSPAQWTVMGKPVASLDRVALMTGTFEFVHNVRVPGMVHGRVVRPPAVGATVASVDEGSVHQIGGILKVVVRNNFVGVVAEKQWQAIQAARQLKVAWKPGPRLPAHDTFYDTLRKLPSRDALVVVSKDVDAQLASAKTIVRATYAHPFQMHASIGSSCAVADVKGDRATVWSATQSVYPTRSIVSKILQLPLENVRVIYVRGSGCYGLNGADAVSFDAAVLSHAVQRPVRVQLSRQDEMAWENFGAACVIDQRAGLDQASKIVAWDCENWIASRGGRPGYDKPGNVITGVLLDFEPEPIKPQAAKEPSGELRNGSNAVPSYVSGCISGKCGGSGSVRSERVLTHTVQSPFFTGPLRSPLRIQNTFAHECFMDELSERANADPVEFRLRHLREQRIIDAIHAAAKAANWQAHASRKEHASAGRATGRGVACVAYEGNNGYCALVAEVAVDLATGHVRPEKFTVAIDAGPITNPDGLCNQTEGGVLQGMSRALGEEVVWDAQRVTSDDWTTYKSLYLGIDLPVVNVVLINRTDVPATGAGETAITLVAAALGNAIYDASGVRLREVPFTPERLLAGLRSRATTVSSTRQLKTGAGR